MAAPLDLNLLVVLDVLLDERSVTGASMRLHRSVPATSRALGRLRLALGDQLLVRAGNELVLTPRALELQPRLRQLIEQASTLTVEGAAFHPETLERSFALRSNDVAVLTIGSSLLERVRAQAPGVILKFLPEGDEDPALLRNGSVDLDIGVMADDLADVVVEPIGEDPHVGVVRVGHPLAGRRVSAAMFVAGEHVLVTRRGRLEGPLDAVLAEQGLRRRVVTTVGTTGAALSLVASTDLIATVPESVARAVAEGFGLRWFKLPLHPRPVRYSIAWHARHHQDEAHAWLRELVKSCYRDALGSRGPR